ncbi:related to Stress response protein nst1 [Rhynchosporium graminicola]|uniref:Stress response protein NST1 n=1 Tax=Rhynchosporium graminicola TaxID=2792576 RepID=A0A1E1JZK6_9HELO|nr:related to Stress response protein nst1 [Rhynchosporium commune]
MPANQRQKTAQYPPSPTSKTSSKYTNKDGSKFITVPKVFNISESSETSPAMAQATTKTNAQMPTSPPATDGSAPAVNRKKQKRRQKQAAKLAAEQPTAPLMNGARSQATLKGQMQDLEERFRDQALNEEDYEDNGQFDPAEGDPYYSDEDGDAYSASYSQNGSATNEYSRAPSNPSGKRVKKKKKSKGLQSEPPGHMHHGMNGLSHNHVSLPLPPLATNMPRGPGISKEKIWNTSSQEERERIKEFWLSLGEDERKSLVKVEKDAVLKKMKEQQKHSCSCTVCGRKRTAIEEELEVLYDAYYEELEQYANHQGDGVPPMMPPPRRFGAMSGLQPPNRLPPAFNGQQPSRGRIVEQLGDDEEEDDDEDEEEGDEEYSEDDGDEDDYSDEEPEELPRSHATDFFNFGNSLTVQGGILTVADDLLKNDGKKFIEMMEQLAERRMAREEDARVAFSNPPYGHPPNGAMHPHNHAHNHPPQQEDDEYDDEDEEEDEYDSQDEDYDEEEMDTMTEEQRMEEGRRMFQIFAARMFEQRVLTAYKDKVAKERQQKLLEELEEESRADQLKKAKKAKDAQKKKEKMAQKKQALAEEKAKRDSEKAAEEAALREAEEKKAEEQRLRAEEKRKKKEALKKAEEEERARKEAEKQRRLQEQRERQAELDRKQREAKEKERKDKEELRLRERQVREAKEREQKERKEKLENEKREKDAQNKANREAKEKQKRDDLIAQQTTAQAALVATQLKRPPIHLPASLQPHPIASPHIPIATPAIPKVPTPIKLRTTSSQPESNSSVPQTPQTGSASQNVSPVPSTPLQGSPGPIGPPGKNQAQNLYLHHPQATSPMHAALKSPPGMHQASPFGGMPPMNMGFQPGLPMMGPGFNSGRMQHDPMFSHQPQFRPMAGPNGMPLHPGLGMHMPQGRGFPLPHGPPGFPQQIPNGLGGIGQAFGATKDGPPPQPHSRQHSGTYEPLTLQAQPIARPAPIGRPGSVVHGQHRNNHGKNDMDDLSNHLGSSALLDDSDEPLNSGAGARRSSAAPGGINRQPFVTPFGIDPATYGGPMNGYNGWGAPNPFGPSSLPGSNYMGGVGGGGGWGSSANNSFGAHSHQPMRPSQPRSISVRLMLCRACKSLEGTTADNFFPLNLIKEKVDLLNPPNEQPVSEKEILDICETEGNGVNGGGAFDIRNEEDGKPVSIRFGDDDTSNRPMGAPGEIGSPIVGFSSMRSFPGPPPGLF